MAATTKLLKMGMIGVGVGGTEILPAMESMPEIDLYAGADANPMTRERFKARYPEAQVYDGIEALCADPEVEGVWVSTPNRFHAPHTIYALEHGKHVVVEKPMALSIEEAEAMVETAEKTGRMLLAGHTRAYTYPIRAMRAVIRSGAIGKLEALHLWAYTDWMLRPRSAEELDPNQGGGMVYRQVPHQADTVRLLGGGLVRSVRASVGQWMPERPIPGYYSAYLEFENGLRCSIMHNGYGYFMGAELVPWGESKQRYTLEERVEVRRQMRTGTRDEEEDKQALRIGGSAETATFRTPQRRKWVPEDLGLVVASCTRGDMRHSGEGIYVYDDTGLHDLGVNPEWSDLMGAGQRRAELEEFYAAVVQGKPMFHTGQWGIGTLEVSLAIRESAKTRKEIMLSHQIAVPDDYDVDFKVPYP
jgi:phthalate 4,5-cis-dihydrodiol dehydrogenase